MMATLRSVLFWGMILCLTIAGCILLLPHLRDSYIGVVLSGRCDEDPKPAACRRVLGKAPGARSL